MVPPQQFAKLDGVILRLPHQILGESGWGKLLASLSPGGVIVDFKSVVARNQIPPGARYWSL